MNQQFGISNPQQYTFPPAWYPQSQQQPPQVIPSQNPPPFNPESTSVPPAWYPPTEQNTLPYSDYSSSTTSPIPPPTSSYAPSPSYPSQPQNPTVNPTSLFT